MYMYDLGEGYDNSSRLEPLGVHGSNATFLRCELRNTTNHVQYNYMNGEQSVHIQLLDPELDELVNVRDSVRGTGPGANANATCSTSYDYGMPCDFNLSLLHQFAYQGLLQAFTSLITGNMTLGTLKVEGIAGGILDNTYIRSTSLMRTKELAALSEYSQIIQSGLVFEGKYSYLQYVLSNGSGASASGQGHD